MSLYTKETKKRRRVRWREERGQEEKYVGRRKSKSYMWWWCNAVNHPKQKKRC